jgi:hypothetical protein
MYLEANDFARATMSTSLHPLDAWRELLGERDRIRFQLIGRGVSELIMSHDEPRVDPWRRRAGRRPPDSRGVTMVAVTTRQAP